MNVSQVPGHRIFVRRDPADAVGGDFHDFIKMVDGRWACIFGTANGRGTVGASRAGITLPEIRSRLAAKSTPQVVVAQLNRWFCEHCEGFVTLLLILIDFERHGFTVVNAGHEAPLVRRADGSVESVGKAETGVPLGVDDFEFQAIEVTLRPGNCFVVFSGGISDAMSADGQFYNMGRLTQQIASARTGQADDVGQHIMDGVAAFIAGHRQPDQMSLLCISRDVAAAADAV